MSVKINYLGRLGNNILQYLMASYLSSKFDLALDQPTDLNDDFEINKHEGGRHLENVVEVNDSNVMEFLEKDSINHGLLVNGFFQNKDIFLRQDVLDFYRKTIIPKYIPNTSDLFVHIRLGDTEDKSNLPYEYYENQMNKIEYHTCLLASDSPDSKIIKKFRSQYKNVQIFEGWKPSFVIRYGANCDQMLLSAGSFSFCMALFRLKNSKVYCIDNQIMTENLKVRQWNGDMFSAFINKDNFLFYDRYTV